MVCTTAPQSVSKNMTRTSVWMRGADVIAIHLSESPPERNGWFWRVAKPAPEPPAVPGRNHRFRLQANEVEKKLAPEVNHAAPGIFDFAGRGLHEDAGRDVMRDLV